MPSIVVHLALAGIIAGALLGDAFDGRALLVVFAVVAFPDLDSFVSLFSTVGHRAALHNVFVPLLAGVVLYADLRRGEDSYVRTRWGARGIRVAWVSLFCYVAVAIGLDLVAGAVNPFWPLHDQFYHLSGKIELSTQRGLVQTIVDLQNGSTDGLKAIGTTEQVHLDTGVDPTPGPDPKNVDRVFPIVRSGWQLVLLVVGSVVTAARFYVDQSVNDDG